MHSSIAGTGAQAAGQIIDLLQHEVACVERVHAGVPPHRLVSAALRRQVGGAVVALDAQQARVRVRGHLAHVRVGRVLAHLNRQPTDHPQLHAILWLPSLCNACFQCHPHPVAHPPASVMHTAMSSHRNKTNTNI